MGASEQLEKMQAEIDVMKDPVGTMVGNMKLLEIIKVRLIVSMKDYTQEERDTVTSRITSQVNKILDIFSSVACTDAERMLTVIEVFNLVVCGMVEQLAKDHPGFYDVTNKAAQEVIDGKNAQYYVHLWNQVKNGLTIIKVDKKDLLQEHDCNTCDKSGNCPIEEVMRKRNGQVESLKQKCSCGHEKGEHNALGICCQCGTGKPCVEEVK